MRAFKGGGLFYVQCVQCSIGLPQIQNIKDMLYKLKKPLLPHSRKFGLTYIKPASFQMIAISVHSICFYLASKVGMEE